MAEKPNIQKLKKLEQQLTLANETFTSVSNWRVQLHEQVETMWAEWREKIRIITLKHLSTASVCTSRTSKLEGKTRWADWWGCLFTVPKKMLDELDEVGVPHERLCNNRVFSWSDKYMRISCAFFESDGNFYLFATSFSSSLFRDWVEDQGKLWKWHTRAPYFVPHEDERIFHISVGARQPVRSLIWKLKKQTHELRDVLKPYLGNESEEAAVTRAKKLIEEFETAVDTNGWGRETTCMTLRSKGDPKYVQRLEITVMRGNGVAGGDYAAYLGLVCPTGLADWYDRMVWCAKKGVLVSA